MDCSKTGGLIRSLRLERRLTQKQLADRLSISDKTVSKWERGSGCPDVSVLGELASLLGVGLEDLLRGELSPNPSTGGNMKKSIYYVCPTCGNLILATSEASISCCGRKLEPLEARKAPAGEALIAEPVESDWYLTSSHPMAKDHFITFVAFAAGDRVQLVKLYPEWDLQVRFPRRGHGLLLWHCSQHGLFYQLL